MNIIFVITDKLSRKSFIGILQHIVPAFFIQASIWLSMLDPLIACSSVDTLTYIAITLDLLPIKFY